MTVIEYTVKNIEPVKITNDNRGNKGERENQIETMNYITGSAVRGAVINFAAKDGEWFEENRIDILTDNVRFLNAYPLCGSDFSIPSPKGYYAEKGKEEILYSVLDENNRTDDKKRADIGSFCTINGDIINYTNVRLGEAMGNNVGEKKIYRSGYIKADQYFGGYIVIDNDCGISDKITEILNGREIYIGASSSRGYGKCLFTAKTQEKMPYENYMGYKAGEMYLMLLSDTVMLNKYGEPCGLDAEYIKDALGVSSVEIERCATSIVKGRGHNRTWECDIPNVIMYEKGSVFKLKFKNENPDINKMKDLMSKGLGIRLEEGFGQILFTDKLRSKMEGNKILPEENMPSENERHIKTKQELSESDKMTIKTAARNYLRIIIEDAIEERLVKRKNDSFSDLSLSQSGNILSMITILKFTPAEAKDKFESYFNGIREKKASLASKYIKTEEYIKSVFDGDIEDLLGIDKNSNIFDAEMDGLTVKELLEEGGNEDMLVKLDLLEREIRYYFRKGEK